MTPGQVRFAVLAALFLAGAGCATAPIVTLPPSSSSPGVPLPSSTRVLGEATVYISAGGERVEVVHDAAAGIAIVKLPDGAAAALPEEIAGSAGRYRDKRMTVWESDGGVLLWVEGRLVFSGRVAN